MRLRIGRFIVLWILGLVVGCQSPSPPVSSEPVRQEASAFIPYVPSTLNAFPEVTEAFPDSPRDAPPDLKLIYSVEIWQILLPRDSISSDESFWKRVNEGLLDLSPYTILFKNGIRVGALPLRELSLIQQQVDERKGNLTRLAGISGKAVEIPIRNDIPQQTLFYFNRAGQLIGRWYDRCENLFYFSFEPTPRRQNYLRIVLTPAVRGLNKRLRYVATPGRAEDEIRYKAEEVQYDASLNLDLPLNSFLVVGPSTEARDQMTIGGAFLIQNTPSEQLERLIVIIPRAFRPNPSAPQQALNP